MVNRTARLFLNINLLIIFSLFSAFAIGKETIYFTPYVDIVQPDLDTGIAIEIDKKLFELNYNELQKKFSNVDTSLKVVIPQGSSYWFYEFTLSQSINQCQYLEMSQPLDLVVQLDGVPIVLGTPSRFQVIHASVAARWRQHSVRLEFPNINQMPFDVTCNGLIGFTAELSL
ncbi:hypothetical protein [Vibrio chagasii]|uniref:hypothetical protein n=1 Tax=Vibrio chagasii TaxID=170679 RepID=UPI002283A927|nr:hypothetical protein [Vibrio chagasii]MCY9829324.1 hypothetical protein [Vibrio chagasii]